MRIVLLTQFYPPETGAPQNRLKDLAHRLAAGGHTVTVVTAMPNYPKGQIFEGYRGRLRMDESDGAVRVVRAWIMPASGRRFLKRLLSYWSFVISSAIVGYGALGRQDIVLVESPPLFLGLTGMWLSKVTGARMVFNVSDLWPASAAALGMVRNRALIGLAERLELYLYRHSALVTGQTEGIVASIRARLPRKPIMLLPNGVDAAAYETLPDRESVDRTRREFGLDGRLVVGYAGLHGYAQDLQTVLDAASVIGHRTDIIFALFGDGPAKPELVAEARRRSLRNVVFFPTQPWERMTGVWSCFDLALVPLRAVELFRGALPSKLFEAMASGIAVVGSLEGEAKKLIATACGGICVAPGDAPALAQAVLELCDRAAVREQFGRNGRAYVLRHYDRRDLARALQAKLDQIMDPKATDVRLETDSTPEGNSVGSTTQ